MPTADNAKVQFEAGQTAVAMAALTAGGDATSYTGAGAPWSRRSGYAPVIRPNGLLTGGVISVTGTNNVVSVSALTCNLNGVVTSVASGTATITRPSSNVAKVCSITVNSSGALAVVAGADGSDANFSETRGANGGPPFIPATSIEIGQVRVTTSTAAVVAASQILQVVGVHQEQALYPPYTVNYRTGTVTFAAAQPLIHTSSTPKSVFASYATPIFADVPQATDFVAPETAHSVTSTAIYGGTIGNTSSTLNQGSFTAYLEDGVNDALVLSKNQILWFKHFPDRTKSSHVICQGKLGIARTWPATDGIQAACTISADAAAEEVA